MTLPVISLYQDFSFSVDKNGVDVPIVFEFIRSTSLVERTPQPKIIEEETDNVPLKQENTDLALLRAEAVELYAERFTTTVKDGDEVSVRRPLTICNNRELDVILTTAETWEEALEMMHSRIGHYGPLVR